MKKLTMLFCAIAMLLAFTAPAQYNTERDVAYREAPANDYIREKCVLDVYYPEGVADFQTLVWFHGGGLEGGAKFIPGIVRERGIAVVAVGYRLSPKATHPAYIEDAAAAVAWTVGNIGRYGGDPGRIHVSGHSAGGYLASMVGLDKSWLAPYGLDPDSLAGFYPISGQAITHYTIKKEMGLPAEIPYIDKYAPLVHIRRDAAPFVIIVGEASMEMKCRTAENFYLYEALRSVGNKRVKYHELSGFNHNTVCDPGLLLVLREMGAL